MHSLGARSDLGLTAIVASQRYASLGLGTSVWHSVLQATPRGGNGLAEAVDGAGVRLSLDQRLDEQVTGTLTLQSRIEMDAFKAYRGVNSEPGDFDIPGFVSSGLRMGVTRRATLQFDIQRVFYSEVSTFSSAFLPTRFLSLLGDGSSPVFAWRDLTVFGVEAVVEDAVKGRWSLRYSTQQQPRPTSSVLDRVLSERYSDNNFSLGYRRELGSAGALQLAATYSPVSYFLGAIPFANRQLDGGRQVEFEARWSMAF
jgi:long-subunit fatty acid transport protein